MSSIPLIAGESLPTRTRHGLYALAALNSVLVSFTWPLAVLLSQHLGVSGAAQGMLLALQSLGGVLSATWTGALCDRLGKRAVFAGHLAVMALGWALAGLSLSYATVALALFLTGVGAASLTALSAYFGAHTAPELRSQTFARMLAMRGLGQMAGPLVLLPVLPFGMPAVCLALTAGVLLTAFAGAFVRDSRNARVSEAAPRTLAPARAWAWHAAGLLPVLCAMGLLWTSPGSVTNYVPLHAKDALGAGDSGLAMLFSALGLTMVVAPAVLWAFGRVLSERAAAHLAYSLTAGALVVIALAPGPFVLLAAYVAWALMWDVTYPYVKAELSRRVPAEDQARVMGAEQFVTGVLMALATTAAGAAYAGLGPLGVFAGAAALGVAGAVLFWQSTRASSSS